MKNLFPIPFLFLAFGLAFCTSSKKTTANSTSTTKTASVTYLKDIQPIVANTCAPCHFPPDGNKKPLNDYESVKSEINDIITRIQLNPGDRGFMPARHPKLPEASIQAFVKWKEEGLAEK
jgi:hypothetical protein